MNEFETKIHQHDITLARLETLIEQNDRRFDIVEYKIEGLEKSTTAQIESLKKSTAAQIEGLEKSTTAQIESLEKNTTAQIESLEKSTTAQIESLKQNTTAQIESLEKNTAARIDAVERKIESLDRRMNWFLGLLFTSWLSTIGVILYKLQ